MELWSSPPIPVLTGTQQIPRIILGVGGSQAEETHGSRLGWIT